MKKELKEYLHLYIGCEVNICEYEGAPFMAKLTGIVTERTDHESMVRVQAFIPDEENPNDGHIGWYDLDEVVELILRPLSSMTEEENKRWKAKMHKQYSGGAGHTGYLENPESFRYLLSIGIDLFGLIDSGLAVTAETLK